jgi:hypothetical protein
MYFISERIRFIFKPLPRVSHHIHELAVNPVKRISRECVGGDALTLRLSVEHLQRQRLDIIPVVFGCSREACDESWKRQIHRWMKIPTGASI